MSELSDLVERALREDLGDGDITSESTVPEASRARARIVQKQPGALSGFDAVAEVFDQVGAGHFNFEVDEGTWSDQVPIQIGTIEGPSRAILAGERVALNILGRMSGIATLTAEFMSRVNDTEVAILDTRKTTPGLRFLEKAAVVHGGGTSHRWGLYDAILIKENHIALAGSLGAAVAGARAAEGQPSVEVECRDLAEVEAALEAGADRILLDNMDDAQLVEARELRDRSAPGVALEASGGITLANVASVASTGVDFISIGALTHSAPNLDLSLLLEEL